MIRVMVVDDHELVRMGLCGFLDTEAEMTVVGEAGDGATALRMVRDIAPDVIVMDMMMPGMSGIETTEALREAGCQTPVVMLTSSMDNQAMIRAVRAGVLSYLLKTSAASEVANAIRDAAKGEAHLDARVQQALVRELQVKPVHALWETLTERELDVLRAIASGKNNQEIADALHIGVKTVKTHVSNIFLKVDVQDRTQAAIYAIRQGLV